VRGVRLFWTLLFCACILGAGACVAVATMANLYAKEQGERYGDLERKFAEKLEKLRAAQTEELMQIQVQISSLEAERDALAAKVKAREH
jgi:hypothetical protein